MALTNWRTINIDALDPESPANFDIASLHPAIVPISAAEAQQTTNQIRQLLRGGDSEGALRGALDTAPYGADDKGKVSFLFSFKESTGCLAEELCAYILANRTGCANTTIKQELHLAAVIEILQSIRQSEMTPILNRVYESEGGSEALDVLMKYMFVTQSRLLDA
jgi:actin related protein 2/3 complex subunit 5